MLFLGIDWGEAHHNLCLLDQDGRVLAARRVVDGLAGVEELHSLVAAQAEQPAGGGRDRDRPGPAGAGAAGRRLPGLCGQPAGGGPLPRPASSRPGQVRPRGCQGAG
jgi:2-keto-3-deoxy-galactonokinase